MAQMFHPSTNTIARVGILGSVIVLVAVAGVAAVLIRSPWFTGVNAAVEQPVPFSHAHHVAGIGIDCRYCHTAVEDAAFAGMPPTGTCMNCHTRIWPESPMLAPVRASFATGRPIAWNRVYDLPDFAYFDHSIHVAKGVGCVTCHGRVDRMPLLAKAQTLHMEWCLGCHRDPGPFLRPREEVFDMQWEPDANAAALGAVLIDAYDVRSMTDCSVCHR